MSDEPRGSFLPLEHKEVPTDIHDFNREEVEGPEDRFAKLTIYVLGMFAQLREHGLIEGGHLQLSPKGMEAYEKLEREGFGEQITKEELEQTILALQLNASDPD